MEGDEAAVNIPFKFLNFNVYTIFIIGSVSKDQRPIYSLQIVQTIISLVI